MEGVVNHNSRGAESLCRTCLGLEGALSTGDEYILFVEVANVFYVDGSHGVEIVGITVGFVAEVGIGFGWLNNGVGRVGGGEFG